MTRDSLKLCIVIQIRNDLYIYLLLEINQVLDSLGLQLRVFFCCDLCIQVLFTWTLKIVCTSFLSQ